MRQLDENEKRITEKSIKRIKDEIEFAVYNKKYAELMIETGLEQEFKAKRRLLEKQLVDLNHDINGNTDLIKTLEDQLKNGVASNEEIQREE